MTNPTRGLVDEWNENHMADLAAPAGSEDQSTVSGPEEMLEKVEAFVEIGFDANAEHLAQEFQDRYDVDIADLIEGTKYERSCLANL